APHRSRRAGGRAWQRSDGSPRSARATPRVPGHAGAPPAASAAPAARGHTERGGAETPLRAQPPHPGVRDPACHRPARTARRAREDWAGSCRRGRTSICAEVSQLKDAIPRAILPAGPLNARPLLRSRPWAAVKPGSAPVWAVDILGEHTAGAEHRTQSLQRGLDPSRPAVGKSSVTLVEGGQHLVVEQAVKPGGVAHVLDGVVVLHFPGQRPPVVAV